MGFAPSVLTVTVGSEVAWYNATGQTHILRSGELYLVYLPIVLRSGGSAAAQAAPVSEGYSPHALHASDLFSVTLAPGTTFTYTFATTGTFPFYVATAPRFKGHIAVKTSLLPPDPGDVAPPVEPGVATDMAASTEFLYTGSDPLQTGVAPGTIEARRVGVLRGRVMREDGAPLAGVQVTVLNHPEYGQTLTV